MTKLYVVFDTKAKSYSEPMCCEDEIALQQFLSVLINTHSEMPQHKFPEDFVVYAIADVNMEVAKITPFEEKELVSSFSGLKRKCKFCEAELKEIEDLEIK